MALRDRGGYNLGLGLGLSSRTPGVSDGVRLRDPGPGLGSVRAWPGPRDGLERWGYGSSPCRRAGSDQGRGVGSPVLGNRELTALGPKRAGEVMPPVLLLLFQLRFGFARLGDSSLRTSLGLAI
ncbi:hypothetical protein FGB62_7g556 [Gracilaria domingensis]|nr:hypothetical protein FGB62_7g556 [Gracilaria domingensis]